MPPSARGGLPRKRLQYRTLTPEYALSLLGTDVLLRDRRVPLEQAAVVARDVQPPVALAQLVWVGREPVGERDVRLGAGRQARLCATLLDAAVPRADVLADVAAVHLCAEPRAVVVRHLVLRLRPASRAAPRMRPTRCSAGAGRAQAAAPARARSSRAPPRRLCARPAAASPDGTTPPGAPS